MCDFESRQLLRVLPCNHEFHAKCVDKWLKVSGAAGVSLVKGPGATFCLSVSTGEIDLGLRL